MPSISPLPPKSPVEGGEARPCPSVQQHRSNHRDTKVPMSHNRSLSDSSNDAAAPSLAAEETRCSFDKKRKAPVEDESAETQGPGRARPASRHSSGPVEPPLAPTHLPPIAVPSILNPAKGGAAAGGVPSDSGRDVLGGVHQASVSPRLRLAHPSSSHHAKRLSMSPGLRHRPMTTPVSPSARFVNTAGSYPGKQGTAHQSPLAHESRPGMYSTPGSPMPVDPVVVPSTSTLAGGVPASASVHSTPTFHSRRPSAGPTPIPSPQETSPTTPHSVYSHFGRSSPTLASMSGPPQVPSMVHSSPYGMSDPVGRLPSVVGHHRCLTESSSSGIAAAAAAAAAEHNNPGLIPCFVDMKSGSSSQAEKRKANSDASRRFRNRKRNELQMEQKITAQQEEMRNQADLLHRQTQEIRTLLQEREFYRAERDFYREQLGRVLPHSQLPTRPASPRILDKGDNKSVWQQTRGDATSSTTTSATSLPAPAPVSVSRQPLAWTTAPAAYSTASSTSFVSEEQPRTLPQLSRWAR